MRTTDIRVPLFLFVIIVALLVLCKPAKGAPLTPDQRALVTGLTKNNKELMEKVAAMEKQIEADATTASFAAQRNESLMAKLIQAEVDSEAQLQDLLLQQGKITALEKDRDFQFNRAEENFKQRNIARLEAHRNAVERDIGVFFVATFGTILVMSYAAGIIGWIVKMFPALAPYGLGLEIALAIFSFAALFGAARGTLAIIASKL